MLSNSFSSSFSSTTQSGFLNTSICFSMMFCSSFAESVRDILKSFLALSHTWATYRILKFSLSGAFFLLNDFYQFTGIVIPNSQHRNYTIYYKKENLK